MGKARRKVYRKLRAEAAQMSAAAGKRGLWSSLGSALLGGIATLATGGAASPIVAGLFAGGARALGGHLFNYLAGQTAGGKIKGGRFFQDQRESLAQNIKDTINVGAVRSALKAGGTSLIGKLGGKLTIDSKGDVSGELDLAAGTTAEAGKAATTNGGLLGKIFKGGEKAVDPVTGAPQTGFKGLIDYQGSALGKFFGKQRLKKIAKLERQGLVSPSGEVTSMGKLPLDKGGIPDLESLYKEELSMDPTVGFLDQDVYRAQAGQLESMDPMALRGQSQWDVFKSSDPAVSKVDIPEMQYETPGTKGYGGMPRYQTDMPLGDTLSAAEQTAYSKYSQMMEGPAGDATYVSDKLPLSTSIDPTGLRGEKTLYDEYGAITGSRPWEAVDVARQKSEEFSKTDYAKLITGDPPPRPDVPLLEDFDIPAIMDEVSAGGQGARGYGGKFIDGQGLRGYGGKSIYQTDMPSGPGPSEFDESLWESSKKRLEQIDAALQRSDPNLGLQASNYDLLGESRARAQELQRSLGLQERLGGGSQWWRDKFGR